MKIDKGSIIKTENPYVWIQSKQNSDILVCSFCSIQLAIYNTSSCINQSNQGYESCCNKGCKDIYCSNDCRINDIKSCGHWLYCVGINNIIESSKLIKEYTKHSSRQSNSDLFKLAIKIIGKITSIALSRYYEKHRNDSYNEMNMESMEIVLENVIKEFEIQFHINNVDYMWNISSTLPNRGDDDIDIECIENDYYDNNSNDDDDDDDENNNNYNNLKKNKSNNSKWSEQARYIRDQMHDNWSLLQAALIYEPKPVPKFDTLLINSSPLYNKNTYISLLISKYVTFKRYSLILGLIENSSQYLSRDCIASKLAKNLPNLSNYYTRKTEYNKLKELIGENFDNTTRKIDINKNLDNIPLKYILFGENYKVNTNEIILFERKLARISQLANSTCHSENNPFENKSLQILALFPSLCYPNVNHSCIPNVIIELNPNKDNIDINDRNDDICKNNYGFSGQLIALRNINDNELLVASYIVHTTGSQEDRQEQIHRRFPKIKNCSKVNNIYCSCHRCYYDDIGHDNFMKLIQSNNVHINRQTIIQLANQFMQDGTDESHITAIKLYRSALTFSYNQSNKEEMIEVSELYHTLGAALLETNKWIEAHNIWRYGMLEIGSYLDNNNKLVDQNNKLNAYYIYNNDIENSLEKEIKMSDFYDIHISLNKNNSKKMTRSLQSLYLSKFPIISKEECISAIFMAEEFANINGGWTTSRHHAVPTTDLPVCAVKPLLDWFNLKLEQIIMPMLKLQFLNNNQINNNSRIIVHDAFIVKYQNNEEVVDLIKKEKKKQQRHLPLHFDQSTHSLTIALNSLDDYQGGGTYFDDLDVAFRAEQGHILSFPGGSLLHGGDPLLSGTRYIIAVFILINDDDESNYKSNYNELNDKGKELNHLESQPNVFKKQKIEINHDQEGDGTFCFNFDEL